MGRHRMWGGGGGGVVQSNYYPSTVYNSIPMNCTLQMLFSEMRMFLEAKSLCTNPLSAR